MRREKITEKIFLFYGLFCAVLMVSIVFSIIIFLTYKGLPSLNMKLIFGQAVWYKVVLGKQVVFEGIWNAIVGTVFLVVLAVGIAAPLGISAGIYFSEYCRKEGQERFSFFVNLLAGMPSILMGLFGLSCVLLVHKYITPKANTCLFVSAFSLSFLVLPYLIKTTWVALDNIPQEIKVLGASLGFTRVKEIFYIKIPYAIKNIFSGVILSIGRCAEDTAVIMLTGVVALGGIPSSLFDKYEALPFYIFYMAAEYSSPQELSQTYGAALVLLLTTGLLFLFAHLIKRTIINV